MKYSFRLVLTGQKKNMYAQWGLPLNLQACPKCAALNNTTATLCVKCSHPLSEPGKPAENSNVITNSGVAPETPTERGDLSQHKATTLHNKHSKISDDLKSKASTALPAGAAASQAAPASDQAAQDVPANNRRFSMSNEQKWQRRIWGAVFFAFFAIPIIVVVISLQPSITSPYASKNLDKNTGSSAVIQPPVVPVQDIEMAATAPLTEAAAVQQLPETKPQAPTPAKPSAPATPATPAVPIPQPEKPGTPENSPCSEAAHALALCDTDAIK
ncbi:MAG: hypothetical protein ABI575_04590 [Oxalobacteraceae bacterium]